MLYSAVSGFRDGPMFLHPLVCMVYLYGFPVVDRDMPLSMSINEVEPRSTLTAISHRFLALSFKAVYESMEHVPCAEPGVAVQEGVEEGFEARQRCCSSHSSSRTTFSKLERDRRGVTMKSLPEAWRMAMTR